MVPTVLKAEMQSIQQGSKDCGLFAIVYTTEIAYGHDPSSFIFDQSKLRQHLHDCLISKSLTSFPKKDELKTKTTFTNITSNYQQQQTWESPSKPVRPLINKSPPVFESHNRFKALSPGTARHSKQPSGTMSFKTMPTSNETTRPSAPKTLSNTTESLIVNLSKRSLTETEKSVLELGLTFCHYFKDSYPSFSDIYIQSNCFSRRAPPSGLPYVQDLPVEVWQDPVAHLIFAL